MGASAEQMPAAVGLLADWWPLKSVACVSRPLLLDLNTWWLSYLSVRKRWAGERKWEPTSSRGHDWLRRALKNCNYFGGSGWHVESLDMCAFAYAGALSVTLYVFAGLSKQILWLAPVSRRTDSPLLPDSINRYSNWMLSRLLRCCCCTAGQELMWWSHLGLRT